MGFTVLEGVKPLSDRFSLARAVWRFQDPDWQAKFIEIGSSRVCESPV